MNVVIKIINKIMTKTLNHRQCGNVLDEVDRMYSDLLLYIKKYGGYSEGSFETLCRRFEGSEIFELQRV